MSLKVWFYSREGRDDDPLPEGEGISFLSSRTKLQGVGLSIVLSVENFDNFRHQGFMSKLTI